MLWIAIAFVVALMIGFLVPRKPLKLDLEGPPPGPPPDDVSNRK
jgi:hypothetical protein